MMIKCSEPRSLTGLLLALMRTFGKILITACLIAASLAVASAASAKKKKPPPGAEFFTEPTLRAFTVEVSESELVRLRQSPRAYVTGQVVEAAQVLTNVGIRLRGHGSFRTVDEKPNFTLKFDEFTRNQTYRGLTKLMLHNATQDQTGFADFVARPLFTDAGLPSTRVAHARVQLNGRDLGLYVAIEAMNKEFLKEHFANANGNLYEANLTDIDVPLEQDTGVRSNQLDRVELFRICTITNRAERWRELPKVLDVDKFVSFAAMEMLTSHWDGYILHTNNYRMYHDPRSGQFVFMPHGMDWALLRWNLSIDAPRKTIVGQAVLDTPEGSLLYRERVGKLFTNVMKFPVIADRVDRELAKIRTGNLSSNDLAKAERGAALIKERVLGRITRASNELAGVKPVILPFDTNRLARLIDWRADFDGCTGVVDRVVVDGKQTLHIGAAGVYCHPSWRSLYYLPRGAYRFEGILRIAAKGPIAAMLRISGPSAVTVLGSATDWRPVSFDFEIRDEGMDIEFVCDFSGAEGEAWFALDSLQVRRLR